MSSTTHVTLTPLLVGTLAAGLTIYASVPAPEAAAPAPRPHVCSLRPALGLSQVLDAPGVRVLAGQATLDAEQRVILSGAELLQGAPLAGSDVELHLAPASVGGQPRLWLVVADGAGHVDLWTSLRDRPESRAFLAAAADSTLTLAAIRAALAADLPGLRELAALDLERELRGTTLSVGDATALLATLIELPQGDAGRQIALRAVCRALPDERALGLRLLEAAQADPTLVGSLAEDLAEGEADRPALRQVLVEEALEQRAVAVDLLAHLGGEEGQRALRTAVTSADPAQQAAAFLAFSGSDVAEVASAAQVVIGAALLPEAVPAPQTELEKLLAQRALNALKRAPSPEQKRLMAAGFYLLRVPGGADEETWLSERLPRLADRAVAAFLAERAGQRWQSFDAAW